MPENKKTCADCGGSCCKWYPGSACPEQFGLPGDTAKLEAALKSGLWAIDWWEGDERLAKTFFVRPAMKGDFGLFHGCWGGEAPCVFLTETGCQHEYADRPLDCQNLIPKDHLDGQCIGPDKIIAAKAWLPYQDFLSDFEEA